MDPDKPSDAVRRACQRQPLRGGPLLARRSVPRRSLCVDMAPSSLLAPGQNRLRHGGSRYCHQAL